MVTHNGVGVMFLLLALRHTLARDSPQESVLVRNSPIANKPVDLWSVTDVEYWMNNTLGFPEYSGYVRKHLVDGVTLLELTPSDFEEHFPIANSLHVAKFSGHLKLLKGFCNCGEGALKPEDLWSFSRREPFRAFVVGSLALYYPRSAMLYTYLFDGKLYDALVGVELSQADVLSKVPEGLSEVPETTRTVPLLYQLFFLLAMVAAPGFFMAFQSLRLWPTNFYIMVVLIVHYLIHALSDYLLLYCVYNGCFFHPETSLLKKFFKFCSSSIVVPLAVMVLYFILPHSFLAFIMCLLLLFTAIQDIIGFVYFLVSRTAEVGPDVGG